MIIIATRIILVLIGIGSLIAAFLLGRYVESRKIERFYKKYNEMALQIKRLEKDINYFRIKLANLINNLTEDDMGGK
jgi:tRNA isopentenyl-2-thiomethyl-A-37 hydroxylase MiaE